VDQRDVVTLIRESVVELFSSPLLLAFILISSGFWFTFHQFFDMLPNFVDDWTDSARLKLEVGQMFGIDSWIADGEAGIDIPQERLLNLNSLLIMFTMFVFAWASSKVRVLTSTVAGMLVATLSIVIFTENASVYLLLVGVTFFTIGEMLASPKRQEYMAALAPPGKRALYLGYANMPDGVGWVLGNLIAGASYEEHGDKVTLARRFLQGKADAADVDRWLGHVMSLDEKAREELVANVREVLQLPDSAPAGQVLDQYAGLAERADYFAQILPRAEVVAEVVRAVPQLPDGTTNSAVALRDYLFATENPGQVWWSFVVTGLVSTVLMLGYSRWARSRVRAIAGRDV
jgi:hypothetical protein